MIKSIATPEPDFDRVFNFACSEMERLGVVSTHPEAYRSLITAAVLHCIRARAEVHKRAAIGKRCHAGFSISPHDTAAFAGWLEFLDFDGSEREAVELIESAARKLAQSKAGYVKLRLRVESEPRPRRKGARGRKMKQQVSASARKASARESERSADEPGRVSADRSDSLRQGVV